MGKRHSPKPLLFSPSCQLFNTSFLYGACARHLTCTILLNPYDFVKCLGLTAEEK